MAALEVSTDVDVSVLMAHPGVGSATPDTRFEAIGVYSDSHTSVHLFLKATGLKCMDTFSKSDPFAVVVVNGKEVGRTRVIYNTQDPVWHVPIDVDYFFEEVQEVTIIVLDEDKQGSTNLKHHDVQGQATFTLADLMMAPDLTMSMRLSKPKSRSFNNGTLHVHAEESAACHDHLRLQLRGRKLTNKGGMFSKSSPYFSISRVRESGDFVKVYESARISSDLNPVWPRKTISVQTLCNGDYDRQLRLNVVDSGNDRPIGQCDFTLRQLIENKKQPLQLRTTKGAKAGTIEPVTVQLFSKPTFLDYFGSDDSWELNMAIAIDWTGSNGNPAMPGTLHYIDDTHVNDYQRTIIHLSKVLEHYDSDHMYPVYGFGGRGGAERRVSHCFPLNGRPHDPYVQGVKGVLDAYKNALRVWGLSGPTNFAQVINATAGMAARHALKKQRLYTILVIITDGMVTDLQATTTAIVKASTLPMSIIIIGVGNDDFSRMIALDSDNEMLTDVHGNRAARDIVQFCCFNDFRDKAEGRFAKEVLEELPRQALNYFEAQRIAPPPKSHVVATPIDDRAAAAASVPVIHLDESHIEPTSEMALGNLGKAILARSLSQN